LQYLESAGVRILWGIFSGFEGEERKGRRRGEWEREGTEGGEESGELRGVRIRNGKGILYI